VWNIYAPTRLCQTLSILLVLACASTNAATSSTLLLKFLDSRTGAAVKPDSLSVDGTPVNFQVEAGSLVALPIDDGNHVIVVNAKDYQPMEYVASVTGTNTPVMEIELDATDASELPPVEAGTAILQGHVTDADTGALLRDVKLTLPDASLTTVTDESGRFELTLKVPPKTDDARPAITLEVKAEDYQPMRVKNMALFSGERRLMPVKLERMTSATATAEFNETDEAAPDGPLRTYEWAFDVTLK